MTSAGAGIFLVVLVLAAGIGLAIFWWLYRLIYPLGFKYQSLCPNGSEFSAEPENYNKSIIKLYGKVDRVIPDKTGEKVKRFLIDRYRSATNNTDPVGRYIHQRFLIKSPVLKKGESLLVLHNIKFGKEKLKRGAWLELQGEYLHKTSVVRLKNSTYSTWFGRLHYTHKPKGFLRVLKKPPSPEKAGGLVIVRRGKSR